MRMNPPTFHETQVDEYPQGFIDEVFKVLDDMGVIIHLPTQECVSSVV